MISLTALVLTYNEQDNIRRNLEALVWVPKVIIVDSFSNDGTLEIVRSFPNVQVVQRVFDTHANQWNAGLDRIDTEWTLTLDADYVLTAELQEEISITVFCVCHCARTFIRRGSFSSERKGRVTWAKDIPSSFG